MRGNGLALIHTGDNPRHAHPKSTTGARTRPSMKLSGVKVPDRRACPISRDAGAGQ